MGRSETVSTMDKRFFKIDGIVHSSKRRTIFDCLKLLPLLFMNYLDGILKI